MNGLPKYLSYPHYWFIQAGMALTIAIVLALIFGTFALFTFVPILIALVLFDMFAYPE